MKSSANTVTEYMDQLPEDRRVALNAIRAAIRGHLPDGIEEVIQYGMITYVVPLSIYPTGYLNDPKTPLPYLSLASQKNHMAIYLYCVYATPGAEQSFREEYKTTGKRLDMGKSCVRFRKLDDLPMELIVKTVSQTSVREFIEFYEAARKRK